MAVSRIKIGLAGLGSALAFVAISSAARDRSPPLRSPSAAEVEAAARDNVEAGGYSAPVR